MKFNIGDQVNVIVPNSSIYYLGATIIDHHPLLAGEEFTDQLGRSCVAINDVHAYVVDADPTDAYDEDYIYPCDPPGEAVKQVELEADIA